MPTLLHSEDNSEMVLLDNGFAASYVNGKWVSGIRYDFYEISELYRLEDEIEVAAIADYVRGLLVSGR